MDLGFRDRAALVTGGSRGLGRMIALALAEEGANIAICGRDADAISEVADEVEGLGVECVALPVDLTQPGAAEATVERTVKAFGRLDVLINNAAPAASASAVAGDQEALLDRVWNKAVPALTCARAAVPHMTRNRGGSIVFIGGISARVPITKYGPYMAMGRQHSGAAQGLGNALIANFAKSLSDEAGEFGITVNVVHPGFMTTVRAMNRLSDHALGDDVPLDEVQERLVAAHPIGRMVAPEDVATAVVFLASSQARAITGQCLAVDGGMARVVCY